jgi:ABC-type transport system involved in cytochrome c biogenesis permease subunit
MISQVLTFQQLWLAALAVTAVSAGVIGYPRRYRPLDVVLALFPLAALTLLLAVRWVMTGHPPIFGAFENTLSASWSVAAVVTVAALGAPNRLRGDLQRLLAPLPPLVLISGLLFDPTPAVMGANERALLGYVHGAVGWLGFALLLVATIVAARALHTRHDATAHLWDGYLFRLLCVGFVGLSVTMATGALYSFALFTDWYRWQIVEVLAAVIWLSYALVLHARLFFGWKDRRLAWATIAIGPIMLAAYWVWAFFPGTYHYFGRLIGT